MGREPQLRKHLHQVACRQVCRAFPDYLLMWEGPAHRGWCQPGQPVLGCLRRHTEEVIKGKPASGIPLYFCFSAHLQVPVLMSPPFLPKLILALGFITAVENKLTQEICFFCMHETIVSIFLIRNPILAGWGWPMPLIPEQGKQKGAVLL